MNINNLKRVFIHEVGHFIARELNYKIYKIGLGTESIFMIPHKLSNTTEYSGGTKAVKPKNYVENETIQNPSEYMAVVLYGCIFQTIYLKSMRAYEFRNCFNFKNDANGKHDVQEFSSLALFFNGKQRKLIIDFIEKKYIQKLLLDQNHLTKIIKLDPFEFIENKDDRLNINVHALSEHLADFIDEHVNYYTDLINYIKKIK